MNNTEYRLFKTRNKDEKFCPYPDDDADHFFPRPSCKRIIDLTGALLGLVLLSPMCFLIGLLIKMEDGGPVFFRQVRVGMNGRPFVIWKFRSMSVDAEDLKKELLQKSEINGKIFKMRKDPRVTRIGRYIRRTSMDELPQFWNVLMGDMSLVGPRPAIDDEVRDYNQHDCRRVLTVKPGITGLAQIKERLMGKKLDFHKQLQMDLDYVERQSILLDLVVICMTPWAVIRGQGM